ncbi:hypothetical protein [Pontibacter roseus]|uniref:hypothetical protein n=1 Tax=Pontibacter roseus TaxID=336989 RepID=UPI00035FD6E3|nr:hypothetical protein [Pontibacter roseus]
MKKAYLQVLTLTILLIIVSGCDTRRAAAEEEYIEVVGEYEGSLPEAGFRLNLTFNGPLDMHDRFQVWADSMQRQTEGMVKLNDNIYLNHMPEQMGRKISRSQFQVGVTYSLNVADSAAYNRITRDLFRRNLPFHLNVTGSYLEPERKAAVQRESLQQALDNARQKLDFLSNGRSYEIVGMEELHQSPPYAPEYYEYNRRTISRIKVKARLTE